MKYELDFMAEISRCHLYCGTKAANGINNDTVKEKAVAGLEYYRAVTEWNATNGGKPWDYVLISYDEVRLQSSFGYLVSNRVLMVQ